MLPDSNTGGAFVLAPEEIDSVSENISDILAKYKVEKKAIIKIQLMVEDLLLRILNNSREPIHGSIFVRKRPGSGVIRIQYDGEAFDPLVQENDEFTALLLDNLGVPCKWSYQNKTNTLRLSVKKQNKSGVPALMAAIFSAVLLGLCSRLLPGDILEAISFYLLVPFKTAFLGLLNAFAGVLIFFNVIAGLCGDGKTKPLGTESRRILIRLPLLVLAVTVFSYLILLPLSNVTFSAHRIAAESQAGRVVELLWGIVPNNMVLPFVEGNYIHILILALVFGMALSAVRDNHPELVASIGSINQIIMSVTEQYCRIIPLFVFCSLFHLMLSPVAAKSLTDIWKPVILFLIAGGLLTLVIFIALGIRFQCNSLKVIKAMLPAFLIALSTGSPMAAFSTNIEILENKLGLSKRFTSVGLSISTKLYGPGIVLYLAVMVVYFAEKYQTPISFGWVLIAIVLTVLLTFACPPIPGSFLVIFGVIAKQFGFPDECMIILAMDDLILDGLSSGLCCLLRNAELVFEAGDYRQLDQTMLRKL